MPSVAAADRPEYDLVCIGFGPAALAIAVALHDLKFPSRVLFLEKQKEFAWHAGMLIPGAKMQISFLKDLATFRDPRSHFTFLNYLKENDRLEAFTNLSTFLPQRREFSDYLTWAASHFEHQVQYDTSVQSVEALQSSQNNIIGWRISATQDNQRATYTARNLIIATGGQPQLPPFLREISPKIIHSSHYLYGVPSLISSSTAEEDLHLVVIGGGQSSAETFHDLTTRYPDAKVSLYTSDSALKPSDDSPFVNEIFNPSVTSSIYDLPPTARHSLTTGNRATNYSVVRPELLEELYTAQYNQRLTYGNDPNTWKHRIIPSHRLTAASSSAGSQNLTLTFTNTLTSHPITLPNIDLLVCGTGYSRSGHEALLQPVRDLLASEDEAGMSDVDRDYKLRFRPGVLDAGCGIWLQGVCEGTHGLSDSLLSVLAVRAGEVVESIFGMQREMNGVGHRGAVGRERNVKGLANGVHGINGVNGHKSNGSLANGNGNHSD